MLLKPLTTALWLAAGLCITPASHALDVNITVGLPSVEVQHNSKPVLIQRNQNADNVINPNFAKTSRKCPPFCIQPGAMPDGVKTIGELELIDFLQKMSAGDKSILVVDSRTPDWVERGTIPGAVNIPWDRLNIGKSDPITVQDILEKQLGVVSQDGFLNFENAKTLVLFCNGAWCGQSPTNIKGLLKIGYPAHKLFWYRGGMQDWEMLGMATVAP
ncbi:MAG: rhodanese-like domain-containing protein [Thiobacillus sp.]